MLITRIVGKASAENATILATWGTWGTNETSPEEAELFERGHVTLGVQRARFNVISTFISSLFRTFKTVTLTYFSIFHRPCGNFITRNERISAHRHIFWNKGIIWFKQQPLVKCQA